MRIYSSSVTCVGLVFVVNTFICLEFMWRHNRFDMWPASLIMLMSISQFVLGCAVVCDFRKSARKKS